MTTKKTMTAKRDWTGMLGEFESMPRKRRRAFMANAAKAYGIDGEGALVVHRAYQLERTGELAEAASLASALVEAYPRSVHPLIILGSIALRQRDGETARSFFMTAKDNTPTNIQVLEGLAKAHFLSADIDAAIPAFEEAIQAGSSEPSVAQIYRDLMHRMGEVHRAAGVLEGMAKRSEDAALLFEVAEVYSETGHFLDACPLYRKAHAAGGGEDKYEIARLKAAMIEHRYDEVRDHAPALRAASSMLSEIERDQVVCLEMTAQRNCGNYDRALALLDNHDFTSPAHYRQALAVKANILQDQGNNFDADDAFREALYIDFDTGGKIASSYGSFLLRRGDLVEGSKLYAARQDATRHKVPYENSTADNLRHLDRIVLVEEQGVGDRLALLSMARRVLDCLGISPEVPVFYVGEARMNALLAETDFNISGVTEDDINNGKLGHVGHNEFVFPGDLVRHMADFDGVDDGVGGLLRPDADRTRELWSKYQDIANGRPVIGVAWHSAGVESGFLRSVDLRAILETLPEDAVVVSLQYGDWKPLLDEMKAVFPKMTFVQDKSVDQNADLRAFAAQVAAVDTVVSIDNTTVHVAGAMGHEDTHVLLPSGSECIWYWGDVSTKDPWYHCLNLYRQDQPMIWDRALEELSGALST